MGKAMSGAVKAGTSIKESNITGQAGLAARQIPTKERILDAAEELFAARGFAATAIVDIADVVGIRGPAIYKHYGSKTEVYDAVIKRLFEPLMAMMENPEIVDEMESFDLLGKLVSHHVQHPNISRIIQQATLAADEQLTLLVRDWYQPFFSRVQGQANGGPAATMAFHSMLLGYLTLAPLHSKIFGLDPLSEENLTDQLKLQTRLAKLLADQNWQW